MTLNKSRKAAKPRAQRRPKKTTAKPKPRMRVTAPPGQTVVSVSECTKRFASALSDPWSSAALGACLPIEPVRPSMKLCQRMRISTVIGTNGGAFIVVSPCIASDRAFAWYSGVGYTQSDGAIFTVSSTDTTATPGVFPAYMSSLPFNDTNLIDPANRMSARIVSVGVRGTYTGTALNMAGTWNALISPDGSTVKGVTSNIVSLSSSPAFKTAAVTRKPMTLVTGPIDYNGYEWCSPDTRQSTLGNIRNYPWSGENLEPGTPSIENGQTPIFLMLSGGVAGQGVVFEIIAHFEYSGKLATGLTPSHNDEIAAKGVLSVASAANQSSSWRPSYDQLLKGLKGVYQMGTHVYEAGRAAAPLLRGAARAAPLLLM